MNFATPCGLTRRDIARAAVRAFAAARDQACPVARRGICRMLNHKPKANEKESAQVNETCALTSVTTPSDTDIHRKRKLTLHLRNADTLRQYILARGRPPTLDILRNSGIIQVCIRFCMLLKVLSKSRCANLWLRAVSNRKRESRE